MSESFAGDFALLLERGGLARAERHSDRAEVAGAHGTTVIAVKFDSGVLNVGDRRATAESMILYDRADKILPLDDHTLIALSGSYAKAMEAVQFLKHTFKYYRRSQLQEMSLEGKLAEVTRFLSGNLGSALGGGGVVLPLLSAFDTGSGEGRLFFYDAMGARFESAEFGAAGSGSHRIRGAFDYIVKTKRPFSEMSLDGALHEALVLLGIAADLDAATAGFAKIPPTVKTVTAEGIRVMEEDELGEAIARLG